jgi:hypothetical protein
MMKKNGFPQKTSDKTLARDMIFLCSNTVSLETTQKGIRAFFRHFGGQMIYIPIKKDTGESAKKIRKVLADAVGEKPAREILKKLMFRFGGLQIYIPLERHAFRKTIALEIYERNFTKNESLNDIAREYNVSFAFAYTLWREGQKVKLH